MSEIQFALVVIVCVVLTIGLYIGIVSVWATSYAASWPTPVEVEASEIQNHLNVCDFNGCPHHESERFRVWNEYGMAGLRSFLKMKKGPTRDR